MTFRGQDLDDALVSADVSYPGDDKGYGSRNVGFYGHLTQMIAREDSIEFSHQESYISYNIFFPLCPLYCLLNSEIRNLMQTTIFSTKDPEILANISNKISELSV
ncbi:hypothetical protein L798_05257 [Zootermopsis nevadensis]|uniref:Uncharacterized protein n=1 Tax=Zootermopsis nevadensis TaxID=136037 RepID=A0A067R8R5_ZOONE|nr:hypothetical protein L798_05257 [Zootermopsis nevadensis]